MAKVKGPLFSLEAHGSIAGCLTYWDDLNKKPCVKSLRFPTYRRSPAQASVRDTFSWAAKTYFNLHHIKHTAWGNYTDYKGLVGYVSFMHYMLKRTHLPTWQFELPPNQGFCTVGNHNVGEFIVGGGYMTP
jgi:hypothetical protein